MVEVIPETVGQFTGFTDDMDIEIFEDDFVECVERRSNSWVNTGTGQRGSNSWENTLIETVKFTPESLQRLNYYRRCGKNFKVVGNIHEREQQ